MAAKGKAPVTISRVAIPAKLPKELGALLDIRWTLKLQKEALEAELKAIESDISLTEDAIFIRLGKEGDLSGVRGKLCQASIGKREFLVVEDWAQVYKFIRAGKGDSRFGLLQKRPSITAFREFEEGGLKVPGITVGTKDVLSLTKLK